ncbi:uncharacterized protein LOC142563179 [Dermacentor variabilis]|uniref:uncharacterized protein LOC142563179 n=1 Tax=Dermacentor variabilis TaxID=34621 RepID=UPI003F5C6695
MKHGKTQVLDTLQYNGIIVRQYFYETLCAPNESAAIDVNLAESKSTGRNAADIDEHHECLAIDKKVMKLSYYAHHLSFDQPFMGVRWCLLLTAWNFRNLFPAWLASSFLPSTSTARFVKAFNETMEVVLRDNVVNFGVYLESTLLSRTWLNIIGEPSSVLDTPTEPFPATMNDTFLPNVAAVIAAQVGTADREKVFVETDDLIIGQLGYGRRREEKFAIPPALVASRGFLSLQVPEVNVGMFALRYLILRAIYDRAATYQVAGFPAGSKRAIGTSSMADYVLSCFGQSFRKSLNKSLDEDAIESLMGGRWAVATAMAMTDKDPVTSWRLDAPARRRLLYLAVCASGCGDPDDADHCRDMSRTMPDFIHAYGCAEGADFRCNCSAANNCETHLPSVEDDGYDVTHDAEPSTVPEGPVESSSLPEVREMSAIRDLSDEEQQPSQH